MEARFDTNWQRRALAGEAKAIRLLTDLALPDLHAFCFHRVGRDGHLCEEAVQETLVRAVRDLEQYDAARAGGQIFGWLTGLARNEVRRLLNLRRRDASVASLDSIWERIDRELLDLYARLESDPFDETVLRREETRQAVSATMSQLPPHYRTALEDKYLHGRSVRDIAAGRRVSEKTIESQLSRAREAFRATFLALARGLQETPP